MSAEKTPFTRKDAELACLLYQVAHGHGSIATLTASFGLAAALEPAVEQALRPLLEAGWMTHENGELVATSAGQDWLSATCVNANTLRGTRSPCP